MCAFKGLIYSHITENVCANDQHLIYAKRCHRQKDTDLIWLHRAGLGVATFCLAPLGLHCVAELLLIMSSRHVHTEAQRF